MATFRTWFKHVFNHFYHENCRFIWIDEVAFNSRNMSPYSWTSDEKHHPVYSYKLSYQTNAICALTDEGMNMCKFRRGTNTQYTFVEFLCEMEEFLREKCKFEGTSFEDYRRELVLIFDNATIHSGARVQDFCRN